MLLSQFWCNAVKDEALALVLSEYTKLEKECHNTFVETFKTRASSILKIAFDHYLKNTKSYDKITKETIFDNDLWLKLEQDLNKLYDTTSNNLKKSINDQYEKEVKSNFEQKKDVDNEFSSKVQKIMNKYVNMFKDKTNAAKVIESWNVD